MLPEALLLLNDHARGSHEARARPYLLQCSEDTQSARKSAPATLRENFKRRLLSVAAEELSSPWVGFDEKTI